MDNEALIHILLIFAVVFVIASCLGGACAAIFVAMQFRDFFRRS